MFPVYSQFVPNLFPVIAFEFHRVPSIPYVSSSLYNLGAVQDSSDNRNTGNNRNKAVSPMVCRGRHQERSRSRSGNTIRLANGERKRRCSQTTQAASTDREAREPAPCTGWLAEGRRVTNRRYPLNLSTGFFMPITGSKETTCRNYKTCQ